ncbi:MAG: LacI family DNA-binding transcriptional regulator [Rhizomicrobium sp.]
MIARKSKAPQPARAGAEARGRRSTINDIARLANVSKKTVSRVINDSPFVKAQTRERVREIIGQIGFTPDPQARGLAFRRAFLIGMIYDSPSPQYVVNMQQGVLDALRGSSFELVIRPSDRAAPAFLDDIRHFVERQKLFGVVLPPSMSEDERLIRLLDELDCPYVRIAPLSLGPAETMVVTHDYVGGSAAARYLADLGHTRIAHISGPSGLRSAHERRRGFRDGLEEKGLKLLPKFDREAGYTFDSGYAAAKALLAGEGRPTAIFAGNDEMALGVYNAAREAGLDIPKDLSVVGFDDTPMAAQVWPALTTIKLPIRDMGRMAAEKLLALPKARKEPADVTDVVPTLVVRDSAARPTGAP